MSLLLDLSSMPKNARKIIKAKRKSCIPGDHLFNVSDGYKPGFGAYEERGTVIASLYGYVYVSERKEKTVSQSHLIGYLFGVKFIGWQRNCENCRSSEISRWFKTYNSRYRYNCYC